MKRTVSILLTLLMIFAVTSCKRTPVSNNGTLTPTVNDEYFIDGAPVTPKEKESAGFVFDGLPGISFTFTLFEREYQHLLTECGDLQITATVTDGVRTTVAPVINDGAANGIRRFSVYTGGLFKESYYTEYTAELFLDFTDGEGNAHRISAVSAPATLYDSAHREYCDRQSEMTDAYPYFTGTGFSPYEDLSQRYAVLASAIYVRVVSADAVITHENEYYSSPYTVEYFDGMLTVSMRNGNALNPSLLNKLFVNGKEIYYEIHDGIIRVVIEV